MTARIEWQLLLRVKSPEGARSLVNQLPRATGLELGVAACERYWKDPALYRVRVTAVLRAGELAPAILEALQVCSGVARRWVVGSPECYDGGRWEFTGSALPEALTFPGVAYADFSVRNFDAPEPPPGYADPAIHPIVETPA
jgi:hypothetical protein